MGASAARVKDEHKCPMCDGNKPHVGGSIEQGVGNVLFGGLAAATVGSPCKCQSPAPNRIASGSRKVMVGGKSAARKGDPTDHGGLITTGFDKVKLG
jgi:uncharacterized Zn-binding protein involved in type VI secretion